MEGLKNDIIYQFYYIALYDFEKGNDVDELKMIMYDYEDKELYLECEGIRIYRIFRINRTNNRQ